MTLTVTLQGNIRGFLTIAARCLRLPPPAKQLQSQEAMHTMTLFNLHGVSKSCKSASLWICLLRYLFIYVVIDIYVGQWILWDRS